MCKIEITTMCVIRAGDKVLMINRKKNWPGWAFPGGHLENNESLSQCVRREVLEETGLNVESLQYKGIANIFNTKTKDRLIVSNYLSDRFSGIPKQMCDEGEVKWVEISEICNLRIAEGLEYRLPLFFNEGTHELYIEWDKASNYTKVEYQSL